MATRRKENSSDKAFRALLRERGVAEALIRERVGRETTRQMRGRPEILPGSFIDQALREHVTDVLVRVRLRGRRRAYVYLLLEHKRVSGRAVMFQVLRYLSAVYEHLARVHRGRVPCVLPLIVYNGLKAWTSSRRFLDFVEPQGRPREGSLDFQITVLLDLGATPITKLSSHRGLRGGLLGLKIAAHP